MASRRKLIGSVLSLGATGGTFYLFRANHTLPARDLAAEERFRADAGHLPWLDEPDLCAQRIQWLLTT